MSLLWKSELRLRPGRSQCRVQVRAAWSRKKLLAFDVPGDGIAALDGVLEALACSGRNVPSQATLVLPDEQVYLCMRPVQRTHSEAVEDARQFFALTLGRADLITQVTGSGTDGPQLVAATEPGPITEWREALQDRGLALTGIELALLDDLNAVAEQLSGHCTVALLRDEGISVVQVEDGRLSDVAWERCDPHEQAGVEQRLTAGPHLAKRPDPLTMFLVCQSEQQRANWATQAQGLGWTLLPDAVPKQTSPEEIAE